MNKRLLSVMAALVIATGCATTKSNHSGAMDDYGSDEGSVQNLDMSAPKVSATAGEAGRDVAQVGTTRWIEDSKQIVLNPRSNTATVNLAPRQVITQSIPETYTCPMYTWAETTCQEPVCTGGAGKSELWNAYYSAPGAQKVAALDAALLGIGPSSARSLHASGIFQTKARSWREFRERMNEALKKKVITADQYREVFGTHGEANRANLGYAGADCSWQNYTCTVYGLFDVENGCTRMRNVEQTINVDNKTVRVDFIDPQLQAFETETVVIAAGPEFDSVRVQNGDKTNFAVQSKSASPDGKNVHIVLKATGRFQIPLPATAFKSIVFNDAGGRNMNAVVNVDPRAMGQGNDNLILTLQVTHCDPGAWYKRLGECKGDEKTAKIKLAPAYHRVTQNPASFALPAIPAGHKVWVKYGLHRENSKWYNNAPVAVKEQKLKEFKK